jgi:predicted NBD/HSP70 family sugar kinase
MSDANQPTPQSAASGFLYSLSPQLPPGRSRTISAIAVGFFSAAVIFLFIGGLQSKLSQPIFYIPIAAFIVLFVGLLLFVAIPQLRSTNEDTGLAPTIDDRDEAESSPIPNGEPQLANSPVVSADPLFPSGVLIGLRIGRHSVTCGALSVNPSNTQLLPTKHEYRTIVESQTVDFEEGASEATRMDEASSAIAQAIRTVRTFSQDPILGIGIGVPGRVRAGAWEISHGVHGFSDGMPVVRMIAERLARHHDITSALHMSNNDSQSVASLCHLDNDVRSATRLILSQHVDEPGWESFAAIHLGTGVGAGLVVDGQMRLGVNGWSGEIGHIDLTLPEGIEPDAFLGSSKDHVHDTPQAPVEAPQMPLVRCSCGRFFHFETFVNYKGLHFLSWLQDADKYRSLAAVAERLSGGAAPDFMRSREWPSLVASLGFGSINAPELQEQVRWPEHQDEAVYLRNTLKAYASLLAAGISCLICLMDVERIVLFGSLGELLHPHQPFRGRLQESITRRGQGLHAPEIHCGNVREDVWRGAALITRDVEFLKRSS